VKKFKFRLEKVLEYREMCEQWAKEAFLAARIATVECEIELDRIREYRAELLLSPVGTIEEHRGIERLIEKTDWDEDNVKSQLAVLRDEESNALEQWKLKRIETEALRNLKEEALADWQRESNKKEQDALDEWANTRRAA
jgi:flagellar export protein FliJ